MTVECLKVAIISATSAPRHLKKMTKICIVNLRDTSTTWQKEDQNYYLEYKVYPPPDTVDANAYFIRNTFH